MWQWIDGGDDGQRPKTLIGVRGRPDWTRVARREEAADIAPRRRVFPFFFVSLSVLSLFGFLQFGKVWPSLDSLPADRIRNFCFLIFFIKSFTKIIFYFEN